MASPVRKRKFSEGGEPLNEVQCEDGENFNGLLFQHDGDFVVAISSKQTRDSERWRINMPSLASFPHLTILDLHKNRYITSLDSSVADLSQLKILKLSQCSRLRHLPEDIGSALVNLEEVSYVPLLLRFSRKSLPPLILNK